MVELHVAESALFGYVRYSNRDGPKFLTGVEVERVLLGTSDLAQLLKKVLIEMMPTVPGLDAAVSGQHRARP